MQLVLRRSQRSGGMLGTKVVFGLDARADLTADERSLVSKYGLGRLAVYDSEARRKHGEAAFSHFDDATRTSTGRSLWKSARGLASAAIMAPGLVPCSCRAGDAYRTNGAAGALISRGAPRRLRPVGERHGQMRDSGERNVDGER